MKKVSLFLLSFVLAFVTVEIFLQYVIGFPTHGVEKKLIGISSSATESQYIYKPISNYFTVEGGLKIYRRNNLGLPGVDVDTSGGKRFVAVLGNSYIEAYQVPPEFTAVGVAQSILRSKSSQFELINLGLSKYDAFDLLYRANYFNRTFNFSKVILIITESQTKLFKRHKKIKFDPNQKVKQKESKLFKIGTFLRNQSVLISLVGSPSNLLNRGADATEEETSEFEKRTKYSKKDYDQKLCTVLKEYYKLFGNGFIVINIAEDENESIPELSKEFLIENKVTYHYSKINTGENKINKKGHLNMRGNAELGEVIYEILR